MIEIYGKAGVDEAGYWQDVAWATRRKLYFWRGCALLVALAGAAGWL